MSQLKYAVCEDNPRAFGLIGGTDRCLVLAGHGRGSNNRPALAAAMVAGLVDLLNDSTPAYYPGRFLLDPEDDTGRSFLDTQEPDDDRAPLVYEVVFRNGHKFPADLTVAKLVGMLNYRDHHSPRQTEDV